MGTDNITGAPSPQVTLSPGAARDRHLQTRLRELDRSPQTRVAGLACQTGVNIAIVGEHTQAPALCIVISETGTEDDQRHALESGAAALITPETTPTELGAIIDAVQHGLAVLPSHLAPRIAQRLEEPPDLPPLSAIQHQLMQLLAAGDTLKQAAATTGYSERQARRNPRQLWDTLNTPNQTAGIIQATRYGLLQPVHPPSRTVTDDRPPVTGEEYFATTTRCRTQTQQRRRAATRAKRQTQYSSGPPSQGRSST